MQSQNFDHIHNTDGIYLQCEQPDELSVVVLLQTVYHTLHTYMALRLQYKGMGEDVHIHIVIQTNLLLFGS